MILKDILGNDINLSQVYGFNYYYEDTDNKVQLLLDIFNAGCFNYLKGKNYDVVVDLGANMGLFSLFMSPSTQKIYAIEPDLNHCNMFTRILATFGKANIELHQVAITTEEGSCTMYREENNNTSTSTIHTIQNVVGEFVVPCTRLSTILANETQIDFLKMDIEGGESIIITDPTFPFDKIKEIEVSVHPNREISTYQICDKLAEHGFVWGVTFDGYGPLIRATR